MADKLSIAPPVTVRFSVEGRKRLQALADSNGMEIGEYIRHLVSLDEVIQKRKWSALNAVFTVDAESSTTEAYDTVHKEVLTPSQWGGL